MDNDSSSDDDPQNQTAIIRHLLSMVAFIAILACLGYQFRTLQRSRTSAPPVVAEEDRPRQWAIIRGEEEPQSRKSRADRAAIRDALVTRKVVSVEEEPQDETLTISLSEQYSTEENTTNVQPEEPQEKTFATSITLSNHSSSEEGVPNVSLEEQQNEISLSGQGFARIVHYSDPILPPSCSKNNSSSLEKLHRTPASSTSPPLASTCDICLTDYAENDLVSSSPNPDCTHAFHQDCIVDWLVTSEQCPICRRHYLDDKGCVKDAAHALEESNV